MDKRVEIHGTSRADMNGKRGVATDFHWDEDESKWRYTVNFDSGEAFKVKPASVRAEGLAAMHPLIDKQVDLSDGRSGIVIDFDPSESRYKVKSVDRRGKTEYLDLDVEERTIELSEEQAERYRKREEKKAMQEAEEAGGGAGAGKAKGRGKKGKKGRDRR